AGRRAEGGCRREPPAAPEALALRELRRLARLVEAGLLALDLARVPRQVALALQEDAEVGVHLDERPCDAVPDGSRLSRRPAAVHADAKVVLPLEIRHLQRREHTFAVQQTREVLLERLAVDPRLAVAGTEDHARDRGLALAGAEVLRGRRHQKGFGSCAPCGCSGPA